MFAYDMNLEEIGTLIQSMGEPQYRALQIWKGLYRDLHTSWSSFSTLPGELRHRLDRDLDIAIIEPARHVKSSDGQTKKVVFRLKDGLQIETVLMQYSKRFTLCISSQAGCAMGCVFCATGRMGFRRNLSSGEIIAQVIVIARELCKEGHHLTNIVVMGMGEPFNNYDNTTAAISRLNHAAGYNLGARRFTVSTVGIVPGIRRFADEYRQVNLSVSLHAADDELRSHLLPVNKKYDLDQVMDACRYYVERTGRRISFEWALIRDLNDTLAQAQSLAVRLKGILCHVNAIPLNPTSKFNGEASSRDGASLFKAELEHLGIPCTIRMRRGIDILAGCGQLAT